MIIIKMIKTFLIILCAVSLLSSCKFGNTEEDTSGSLYSGHKVVSNTFTASAPNSQTYIEDDVLSFNLSFPYQLTVSGGTPSIPLDINGSIVNAVYTGGSGSKNLTFSYTVQAGDDDSDGIGFANFINLNGASITFINEGVQHNAATDFNEINTSGLVIDTTAPTISSIIGPSPITYYINERLTFTVVFSEPVTITGTPSISLDIGGTIVDVNYSYGSGSTTIGFTYDVTASDLDSDGIAISSPINLNSGFIKDSAGNDANLIFTPPVLTTTFIDGDTPFVEKVIAPSNKTYVSGELLTVQLDFSETMTVTGSPQVAVDIGGVTTFLNYSSGDQTSSLIFTHLISPGDFDDDGIEIQPLAILNGGTIQDSSGNNANLLLPAPLTPLVLIDAEVPTIESITLPSDGTYLFDELLSFTIHFSKVVNVTGIPKFGILLNSSNPSYIYADYLSGSGTQDLIFTYTVQGVDSDLDGLDFQSALDLNGGSIRTVDLIDASLDLTTALSLIDASNILIDAAIPTVTIDTPSNITSANVANYSLSGSCSENGQNVTLDINSTPLTIVCSSNSWTSGTLDLTSHADTPNFTITADHASSEGSNAIQASVTITKDTTSSIVTINTPSTITAINETDYELNGTCTDNGILVDIFINALNFQTNCSGGTWSTGSIDVSSLSDGTLTVTADHNTATQATTTVTKDTLSPTVTITQYSNINLSNETSYTISGACSEVGVDVDLDIGGATLSVSCTSGAWTSGAQNVSLLSDGNILITVDHSTANQVSQTVTKNTTTPSISSLSAPTSLSTSVDLVWDLNNPGGFTINDYEIQYRTSGSSTWLSFSDSIETETHSTVNSLIASTTYEFRVRVLYNTSLYSDWSEQTAGTTQPDDTLFSSPYAVMNVGGATTTSIVAMYDNTNITLNGVAIAGSPLSKGAKATISTSQFDVLDGDSPFFAAGLLGSGSDGNRANVVWNPVSWAGKSFSFNATRANPQKLHVYAIENTTITVKQGATTLDTLTLTSGNGGTLSWSVYGSYQIQSSGTILAYHYSGSGTTYYDPKPIMPGHTEIIGFPSASMRLTTISDATTYQAYHSDSTTTNGTLNKGDVIQIDPQGTSSLYQGESLLISSSKNISGASFADSNGLCAAPFMPTNLMKKKYIINVDASYVAFASKLAGTIDVYAPTDTIGISTPSSTLTLTKAGSESMAPYRARVGTTTSGFRFISTVPMAAWYHPSVTDGSSSNDETILFGTND